MNHLELRERLGNRTFESGRKLFKNNAVSVEEHIGDKIIIYRVKDSPSRHVVVWNRGGSVSIECECTPKEMGCRHCASVYMYLHDDSGTVTDAEDIRRSIDELSRISFVPSDYQDEASIDLLMTQFYNFIQKKIDKKISFLCKAIGDIPDDGVREELYRSLWTMTDSFESPHDEWSKDTIVANGGMDLYPDDF